MYEDFVPEGNDPGPIGQGGYSDFVPTYEPQPQPVVPVEEPKVEAPTVEPTADKPKTE